MRFIVIGGKGGVGRTTVSAALATVLARQGKRVLLAHVRTQLRMDRLLGCGVIDETIRHVEPNLWAVNMNPRAALRERGMMVLKLESVYRAVMENRLVKHFLRAIPSLDEYSMLGKAWFHTTEQRPDGTPRFDTVIFDGPATGHLLTMLRIPQVTLETVPDGPLTADASLIRDLLVDPVRTALWIVTLAEEIPVTEAEDLLRAAREKAEQVVDAARTEIEQARREAMQDMREDTARLAGEIAAQVLAEQLDADDRKRIMADAMKAIGRSAAEEGA